MLEFPPSVPLERVPDALVARRADLPAPQRALAGPVRVVLPVRLGPGEREFWTRMAEAVARTLEARAGRRPRGRPLELVESGPAPAPPPPLAAGGPP